MKSLSDFLQPNKKFSIKDPNDRRAIIDYISKQLSIDNKKNLYWITVSNSELQECFDKAIKWKKNPKALFFKLIHQKADEWREQNKPDPVLN